MSRCSASHREVWFTSDLHFGVARIVDYCGRPFRDSVGDPDVGAMAKWIAERFGERVHEDDTFIILGKIRRWRQRGRMINVGVDAWGGVPVPASALLSLIEAGPAERAVLDWTAEAVSDHLIGQSVPAPEPPERSRHQAGG